jgi:5-methylcytosine-specific restriction endonuclease McrA
MSTPTLTRKQETDRAYYLRNKERIKARSREWAKENSEQHNANGRRWRENNLAKYRAQQRKYAAREDPLVKRERTNRCHASKLGVPVSKVDYNAIVERDGLWCYLCESEIDERQDLSFDHVIPHARGGAHSESNIKLAHLSCNKSKGNLLPGEWFDIHPLISTGR